MKVLNVSHRYFPTIGGAETIVQTLSERLVKRKIPVKVLTSSTPAEDFNEEAPPISRQIINGIKVYKIKSLRLPNSNIVRVLYSFGKFRRYEIPYNELRRCIDLPMTMATELPGDGFLDLLRKFAAEADIIHTFAFNYFHNFLVYKTCTGLGRKYVISPMFHFDFFQRSKTNQQILSHAARIFSMTEYTKHYFHQCFRIPMEKIVTIGAGIDYKKYKNGDGRKFRETFGLGVAPIVLFMGRHEYRKGLFHLISAMRRVWKTQKDVRLVIAGSSTAASRRWLSNLKKRERAQVCEIGIIFDHSIKYDIFQAADVFAMPSRIDSLGIVYLEAWACGKPVIAADNAIMRCVVSNGVDGCLVKFGDVKGLSRTLLKLLSDKELSRKFGEQGKLKVKQRYTWDIVFSKILREYEHIL